MAMTESLKTTVDETVIKDKCKEYIEKVNLNPMSKVKIANEMTEDIMKLIRKVEK